MFIPTRPQFLLLISFYVVLVCRIGQTIQSFSRPIQDFWMIYGLLVVGGGGARCRIHQSKPSQITRFPSIHAIEALYTYLMHIQPAEFSCRRLLLLIPTWIMAYFLPYSFNVLNGEGRGGWGREVVSGYWEREERWCVRILFNIIGKINFEKPNFWRSEEPDLEDKWLKRLIVQGVP